MKLLWKIKYNFLKKPVMSTSHMKFLDWPDTMQIISSKKIGVGHGLATVYQIVNRNEGLWV